MPAIILIKDDIKELKERIQHNHTSQTSVKTSVFNKLGGKRNMYVLTYSDFLEEWMFTTKENYQRRIQNTKEISRFYKKEGFDCTADVIHYIMKHFDLTLDRITCVNCY